ncbi:MAG: PP2C family protein-serine/threonine phosphatase [Spirillospora sp.]
MISFAARSRPGRLHAANQDRLATSTERGIFIVADGMGGGADAAATAQTVVDELPGRIHACVTTLTGPTARVAVQAAASELSERVRRSARHGPGTTGAATALLLIHGGRALAVHLGDSRIYLVRGRELTRLTDDHSEDGRLTRYMGMSAPAIPGVSVHDLAPGDRLLLCTDGLTGHVDDAVLAGLLASAEPVDEVSRRLVDAASDGGSADDVSLIVVDYGDEEEGRT